MSSSKAGSDVSGSKPARLEIRFTVAARRDIDEITDWTRIEFGATAAERYLALFRQAFNDLVVDPELLGARFRPDLGQDIFCYHLRSSRDRAPSLVRNPRHFILYRLRGRIVRVIRILHDSRDLSRHV